MEHLNWELSVLSRAISFANLSGASSHIGMSQPQLSRIVSRLEKEHGVQLLNRETKRKSSWTADAVKLAELYSKLVQQFRIDVRSISDSSEPTIIRVGALEGLLKDSLDFCHQLLESASAHTLDLQIADLGDLEERYFKGGLDFLLTSREPGRRKLQRSEIVGYQSLDIHGQSTKMQVLSSFEYASQIEGQKKTPEGKIFVSNSLVARQIWIGEYGGRGTLPSEVQSKSKRGTKDVPVYLIGLDHLPEKLWKMALKLVRN